VVNRTINFQNKQKAEFDLSFLFIFHLTSFPAVLFIKNIQEKSSTIKRVLLTTDQLIVWCLPTENLYPMVWAVRDKHEVVACHMRVVWLIELSSAGAELAKGTQKLTR